MYRSKQQRTASFVAARKVIKTHWNRESHSIRGSRQRALYVPRQSAESDREHLRQAEAELDFTKRLTVTEELKDLPFGAVWAEFCAQMGTYVGQSLVGSLEEYQSTVAARS